MPGSMRTRFLSLIVVLVLTAPASVFAQDPSSLEYPYVYKSARAMGMGGAYTAVGGRVDTLFYNPAGLSNIPRDKGWEINGFPLVVPLNLSVETNQNGLDFAKDIQDALDTEDLNGDGDSNDDQLRAANDVLAKFRGENLHLRVADFPSIGKSNDGWAFGVGGLGSVRFDGIAHQGFGEEGLLEVNADVLYGALAGFSKNVSANVVAGLSLKYLHRISLIHNFTARELVEQQDDLGDFVTNELKKEGNALGADVGVLWMFAPDSALKPSLGVSVMNAGDLNFGNAGRIPQSVNLGVSINPSLSWSRSLIVGADYIDVLNNFKQDKDLPKRLRFGAELQLFDINPVELALRAGMYQGAPTAGFDLRLLVFTFSYAMYTEELGAYPGQDSDKRQLLTFNVGW
jgi:hypothetical protein